MRPRKKREKKPYQSNTIIAIVGASCAAFLALYVGLTVAAVRNNPRTCSPTYSLMVGSLVTLWVVPTLLSLTTGDHVIASIVFLLATASTVYVVFAGKKTC